MSKIPVLKITNLIKRRLFVKGHEFNHDYYIDVGKYDNGRYFVARERDPSFCIQDDTLFDALDRAQAIVESYHNSRMEEARKIFDRVHKAFTTGEGMDLAPQAIVDSQRSKPVFVTRVAVTESNLRQCRYCGLSKTFPCMSTRDCELNSADNICQAALIVTGGGEYRWRQNIYNNLLLNLLLPGRDEFKAQIKNGDMTFVNLAKARLEAQK